MKRVAVLLILLGRMLVAVVHSGWQTSWRILQSPQRLAPGFADYSFAPMGPAATTVLACLICLTPGTTAVEVDVAAGRMRLHLLDTGQREAALADIRERFEAPVRILFTNRSTA